MESKKFISSISEMAPTNYTHSDFGIGIFKIQGNVAWTHLIFRKCTEKCIFYILNILRISTKCSFIECLNIKFHDIMLLDLFIYLFI